MLLLLLLSVHPAKAQSVSAYLGFGTATDSSSNVFADNLGGGFFGSPRMAGLFGQFGGDFMWKPHLGFGAEYTWRVRQGSYQDLNYRPEFYDFNAVWRPLTRSARIVPELQGGIGGATLKIYLPPTCISIGGCQSSGQIASSSHFQLHGSAGLRLYATPHIFIRPQIDIHYVVGFSSGQNPEFGSNWVPVYTIAVGYTFGGQ